MHERPDGMVHARRSSRRRSAGLRYKAKQLAHVDHCRAGRFAAEVFNKAMVDVVTRKTMISIVEHVKQIEGLHISLGGVVDNEKNRVIHD